jgi:hypothetical protein
MSQTRAAVENWIAGWWLGMCTMLGFVLLCTSPHDGR